RPLAVDNVVGGTSDLAVDLLTNRFGGFDLPESRKRLQRHPPNRDQRPGQYLRVALLSHDVAVNVVRIDTAVGAEQGPKAGGVEGRPRAKDAAGWNAMLGGDLGGDMCHDIDRVGRDHEHGLRCVLQDLWDRVAEDQGVALQELKARLPRFLPDSCTEDDHT